MSTTLDAVTEAMVMTVLGPVPAEELGFTLPHEHLALDAAVWFYHHDDPR